jgi:hypothetical protein
MTLGHGMLGHGGIHRFDRVFVYHETNVLFEYSGFCNSFIGANISSTFCQCLISVEEICLTKFLLSIYKVRT